MFFRKTFVEGMIARSKEIHVKSGKTIVFAETEEHILMACSKLISEKIANPLIVGDPGAILDMCTKLKIHNITREHISKLGEKSAEFSKQYIDMRVKDGKNVTAEQAEAKMKMPHFYAGMLLHNGMADGMISGINSETKPYHPAFEIIKTKDGISKASGLFIMENPDGELFFFADCALNINPTQDELAEIALASADTVVNFGQKPRIAMLSFSTHGSAKHEMVDKVKNATEIIKKKNSELIIDGEIQLDAAIIPEVSRKKCPDSALEGTANVLIFPDLNSGNIGYKLVQRLGKFKAIGPIMQGLNKPVNDLSRGASVDDIVELAAITVVQSQ